MLQMNITGSVTNQEQLLPLLDTRLKMGDEVCYTYDLGPIVLLTGLERQDDLRHQRLEESILEQHGIAPSREDDNILSQASSSGFVRNTPRSRASTRSRSRSSFSSTPRYVLNMFLTW